MTSFEGATRPQRLVAQRAVPPHDRNSVAYKFVDLDDIEVSGGTLRIRREPASIRLASTCMRCRRVRMTIPEHSEAETDNEELANQLYPIHIE
jgi:hypothetical protein